MEPPYSNRGVTAHPTDLKLLEVWTVAIVKIYRHIDWLSITIADQQNWRQFLPMLEWTLEGHGRHGYRKRYINQQTGIVCETDSTDKTMGTHLTITGEPLSELRAIGACTDDELVSQIAKFGAQCSRVDLTIDVWGCSFTPALLSNDMKHKRAKIPARQWRLIEGHRQGIDGDTFDTGSKDSDKRFRLYDKLAEKRIKDGEAWMRLELALRRRYAKNAVASCAENGTEPTITGHIEDYLHWQNEEYAQVLIADSVLPPTLPRIEANRKRWLKGQVARALAAEVVKDKAFREQFDQMVNYWIEQLTKYDTIEEG